MAYMNGKKIDFALLQGRSAYEIAVDNGFEGTEEEWLESLKGEPGGVKTVNGIAPDKNGNVKIDTNSSDNQVKIEGTDVEETCIKFAKMLYGTDKAESFIFFTDPHLCNPPNSDAENKMLTSLDVLKTYYDATPTSFLVCGGDWLNDIKQSNTNEDACYKLGRAASLMRAKFDRCYTAIGNHENNFPYGAEYEGAGGYTVKEGLSMETIRNLMLPYEKELYYSFDGAQTKFYVMNSADVENDKQMTDYRWEQVAWLAERLKEDDADNSALVIHAALLRPIGEGVFAHLAENLLKLCEAYNKGAIITLNGISYDFADCTGCVRFMLAGHVHDADCVETHYGIPVILTCNMSRSADSGNGYKPTFDLCLADYDSEMFRMVRVGNYGADREVSMASRTAYTNLADNKSDDWLRNKVWDNTNREFIDTGSDVTNAVVTNYIPITMGDVLRFKGFDKDTSYAGGNPVLVYYDENKVYIARQWMSANYLGTADGLPVSTIEDENGVTSHVMVTHGKTNCQFTSNDICTKAKYVRIAALRNVTSEEKVIITVNEKIRSEHIPYTNQLDNAVFVEGSNVANVDTAEYGYVNGYTVSGDGTYAKNSQGLTDGYVATGFIPCPNGNIPIYVKGADWVTDDSVIEGSETIKSEYCRFNTHKTLGSASSQGIIAKEVQTKFIIEKLGDKYYRIIPRSLSWATNDETGEPYYYRLSLYGNINAENGDELIITHGEPIE